MFAIIFSLVRFFAKKKGAINGPVAPTKIENNPLISPTFLNDPIRTNEVPTKKFKVYVKDGDKVKVVRFGYPGMEIKRDDPGRRKSFRARHNCDNPGPKTKARYWSCFQWRAGSKVDN